MIRATFRIDPSTLSDEDWANRYQEALWLMKFELRTQAEMFANLFGGSKK